jgi:hypothetical protein
MMQTLEATLDESGHIHFAEPIKIRGMRRVLVTLLDTSNESDMLASTTLKKMPARGAMKGLLSSVDEFIANKAAEIALEEKR